MTPCKPEIFHRGQEAKGRHCSWSIPRAALVWLFLRLVFFFNSAFSCIISISYLVLELARISYVVCKQRTITDTNDRIKMVLSAVPDSSELSLLVLMWAVWWLSAPTSFSTYSAVKPLILQWTICGDIICPSLGAKTLCFKSMFILIGLCVEQCYLTP